MTECQCSHRCLWLRRPMEARLSYEIKTLSGPNLKPIKSQAKAQHGKTAAACSFPGPRNSNRHNNPIIALFSRSNDLVLCPRRIPVAAHDPVFQDGAVLLEKSSAACMSSINFCNREIGSCSSVHKSLVRKPGCWCPI